MADKQPTYSASASSEPDYERIERRVPIEPDAFSPCGEALLDWTVHRRAGLHAVASLTPAQVGATVVLCTPFGPLWAMAPCRVVSVDTSADRIGFKYATLPGHPEQGEEEFHVERTASGSAWFVVRAVSRPASPLLALGAPVSRRVQRQITDAYVQAALSIR